MTIKTHCNILDSNVLDYKCVIYEIKIKKNEAVLGNSTDLCFIYESLSIQKFVI